MGGRLVAPPFKVLLQVLIDLGSIFRQVGPARGTVAPTRGQVPGKVLLRTSTYKVNTLNPSVQALGVAGWFFSRMRGPSCKRISGTRGPESQRGGVSGSNFSPHLKRQKRAGLQAVSRSPQASRCLQKPLRGSRARGL